MATAKCVETTSESHVHFAKHSPGEIKTRPTIAQNITTTRNQTAAMKCHTYIAPFTMEWRLASCLRRLRCPHRLGCCVSLNVVRIKLIDVFFLIFAHRSPSQQCHDSVAGPDVGRSAAGAEFLFYYSNFVVHQLELKARKNYRHHLVGFSSW